jgi:drug/metabolite transporter (DMT)-like permease
MLAGGTIAMR